MLATEEGDAPPNDVTHVSSGFPKDIMGINEDGESGVNSLLAEAFDSSMTIRELERPVDKQLLSAKKTICKSSSNSMGPFINAIKNTPGMTLVYDLNGNSKVKLYRRDCNGYRYHPITVQRLHEYYQSCSKGIELDVFYLKQLVGLLIQDSVSRDVANETWRILVNAFVKPRGLVFEQFKDLVDKLATFMDYGPTTVVRHDLYIWELRDPMMILPMEIAELVLEDQRRRKFYSCILCGGEPTAILPVQRNTEAIGEELDVQIKTECFKPTGGSKKNAKDATRGIAKLSSFFNVLVPRKDKDTDAQKTQTEYFQPFFAKQNTKVAPPTFFHRDSDTKSMIVSEDSSFFDWRLFRKHATKLPNLRRKCCRCIGFDSKPILAVAKLLKFYENHRPAFFGTMHKTTSKGNPRNPFAMINSLDYEYDSDDDWGDDAEIEDAESISDESDDCVDSGSQDESMLSELLDDEDNVRPIHLVILIIINPVRHGLCPMDTFPMTRVWNRAMAVPKK